MEGVISITPFFFVINLIRVLPQENEVITTFHWYSVSYLVFHESALAINTVLEISFR